MTAVYMDASHHYTWTGDGLPIYDAPGASTIAQIADTHDLGPWHARMAAQCALDFPDEGVDWWRFAADRHRDNAADRGTRVHEWCAWRSGDGSEMPSTVPKGHADQFEHFLNTYRPTYTHVEVPVFNRTHHYAGTLDAIADVPGHGRLLIDVKTGSRIHPAAVACQLAAYRFAEFIGHDDGTAEPMPTVDGCAVLHLRPRSYHLRPVTAGEEQFAVFLYAAAIARHNATADALLGGDLEPAAEEAA